jgi:WD40 repeat protein
VAQTAIAVKQKSIAEARERAAESARLIAESRNTANLRSLMFAIEADGILPSDRALANLVARVEHYWHVESAWWEPHGTWHPLVVSPDGALVVTADGNGEVNVRSLPVGAGLGALPRSGEAVISLALSGDGTTLVGGGKDGSVFVWSLVERRLVGSKKTGSEESITAVAVNQDASLLLAGAGATRLIWTRRPKEDVRRFAADGEVAYVALAPYGRYAASAGDEPTITLFDVRSGSG